MSPRISRRRFAAYGAAALLSATGVDALLVQPHHPVAEHVEIRLSRLPDSFHGFRIAQITDIHFGPYLGKAGVEEAVRIARSFRPDLLTLTGDFVSPPLRSARRPRWCPKCGAVCRCIGELERSSDGRDSRQP